eukprot:scaffold151438_cov26-Tisochrysis_lutea.AAC.5
MLLFHPVHTRLPPHASVAPHLGMLTQRVATSVCPSPSCSMYLCSLASLEIVMCYMCIWPLNGASGASLEGYQPSIVMPPPLFRSPGPD